MALPSCSRRSASRWRSDTRCSTDATAKSHCRARDRDRPARTRFHPAAFGVATLGKGGARHFRSRMESRTAKDDDRSVERPVSRSAMTNPQRAGCRGACPPLRRAASYILLLSSSRECDSSESGEKMLLDSAGGGSGEGRADSARHYESRCWPATYEPTSATSDPSRITRGGRALRAASARSGLPARRVLPSDPHAASPSEVMGG
jgi:hypothetical protein